MNKQHLDKNNTIGFISPPSWFDPATSEFPSIVEEIVLTQQAPLLLPKFDYSLNSIASVQDELNLCGQSLKAMGCDLVAQVGSPFAWAGANSESEARLRNEAISQSANIPSLMTSLAIVDGLRAYGAKKVALNCTYYDAMWRISFEKYMTLCGFEVVHSSNLVDQGLIQQIDFEATDYGWHMTPELTSKSILTIAKKSPNADAIVVTGAGTRTLDILVDIESEINQPIVAADTILYWAIAEELSLTLKPKMGSLATLSLKRTKSHE